MKDRRKETGRLGEELALAHLLDQGYRLLVQNYRCVLGEIDLILVQGETLIFVEVRSRRNHRFGIPEESVNRVKQNRIRQVAQYYLKGLTRKNVPVRFDVVAIILGPDNQVVSLNHIQAAF